ncbi:unnamed protein product [Gadus morhua 'NCC']
MVEAAMVVMVVMVVMAAALSAAVVEVVVAAPMGSCVTLSSQQQQQHPGVLPVRRLETGGAVAAVTERPPPRPGPRCGRCTLACRRRTPARLSVDEVLNIKQRLHLQLRLVPPKLSAWILGAFHVLRLC